MVNKSGFTEVKISDYILCVESWITGEDLRHIFFMEDDNKNVKNK